MKQRSSSFQISDILGLPQKNNSPADDPSSHAHTTILPPASISSALHSSNDPHVPFNTSSCLPLNDHLPPQSRSIEAEPGNHPHHHHLYSDSPGMSASYPLALYQLEPTSPPINATTTPPPPPGHKYAAHTPILTDTKPPPPSPPTGGYLPGSLNSSMFLESSAAAAAHRYSNLFHAGNWNLDNSSDHYGKFWGVNCEEILHL